jgi:hypothetical protein
MATLGDTAQNLGEIPQGRVKHRMGWLLPREHGAYAQFGFPMATAWLLARPGWNAALWTLACWLAFWAHEPLLILIGRRGQAQLQRRGARALVLVCVLLPAATAAAIAVLLMPPPIPPAAFVPAMALAALASLLAARGGERSLAGELSAGLALVWASLPVALAGASLAAAAAIGLTLMWSCAMAAGMLAVRGIIACAKRGSRAALRAAAQLAAAGLVAAFTVSSVGWAPLRYALGLIPIAALTITWLARPPAPRSLRRAGVLLVAANLAALAFVVL